jgi:hypothetical protein
MRREIILFNRARFKCRSGTDRPTRGLARLARTGHRLCTRPAYVGQAERSVRNRSNLRARAAALLRAPGDEAGCGDDDSELRGLLAAFLSSVPLG